MGWWSSIKDAFSRDGVVTRITEKIPVVGLVTAAVQAVSGNGDHAKRALANQANAVITTAGTVGGFVVGGPVGAVAGGALASSAGIAAEYGVSTTIDDEKVKGNTGDISLSRFGKDAIAAGAGGMLGGGGASTIAKQAGQTLSKDLGKTILTTAGKVVGNKAVKVAGEILGKTLGGSTVGAAGGAVLAQGAKAFAQDTESTGDPDPTKPPKGPKDPSKVL